MKHDAEFEDKVFSAALLNHTALDLSSKMIPLYITRVMAFMNHQHKPFLYKFTTFATTVDFQNSFV